MAMSQKVFETLFRINAQWKGARGVAQAQAGLQKTANMAQRVNVRIRGMTASVFKGVAAYGLLSRAASGFVQALSKSITSAQEAQQVNDELALSIERNARSYKELAGKSIGDVNRIIKSNVDMLIAQSEQMEKTGHDAETLQAGWSKILEQRALSPKQMSEQRKAFSDVLSFMFGANATEEEAVELGEQWSDIILQGNQALAKRMGLSQAHLLKLRQINLAVRKGEISAEEGIRRRQQFMVDAAATFADETERVFAKPAGRVAQMWTQIANIFKTIGKPFIARAPQLAESFSKIAISIQPIAEELAKIVNEHLIGISEWMAKNDVKINEGLVNAYHGIKKIAEVLMAIEDMTFGTLFKLLGLFGKTLGEPARLPQLPGAPSGVPVPGGAGTQGEAARRAAEAQGRAAEAAAEAAAPLGTGGAPTPFVPQILKTSALGAERARIASELQGNPRLQQLLMASTQAEVGDQPPKVQQAYMESVVNRALAENRSLEAVLRNPNYYPQATKSRLSRTFSGAQAERMQAQIADVMAGSNIANFATGNESGSVRSGGAPILYNPRTGERFVGENWTKGWIERMRAKSLKGATSGLNPAAAGGGSTNNISMSSPITVNGVAPGREYAVGRQVRGAIQGPMREFLDKIKAARSYESRLGYV